MRKLLPMTFAGLLIFAACGSDTDSATTAPEPKATTPTTATPKSDGHEDGHGDSHEDGHGEGHGEAKSNGIDDKGLGMLQNGHHEEMKYQKLTSTEQAAVDKLLDASRETAAKYPTLKEFKAAGATRGGPFTPGLGIHYTLVSGDSFNADGIMDDTDMRNPLVVIFDGTQDTAKIAGFMYYSVAEKQPEGFPGKNDFWHYHTNICSTRDPVDGGTNAPFGADRKVDPKDCEAVGGVLMPKTQWMVHVWSVPGYEVDEKDGGMFAEVNPKIDCADGTYHLLPQSEWESHPYNFCKSELKSA